MDTFLENSNIPQWSEWLREVMVIKKTGWCSHPSQQVQPGPWQPPLTETALPTGLTKCHRDHQLEAKPDWGANPCGGPGTLRPESLRNAHRWSLACLIKNTNTGANSSAGYTSKPNPAMSNMEYVRTKLGSSCKWKLGLILKSKKKKKKSLTFTTWTD